MVATTEEKETQRMGMSAGVRGRQMGFGECSKLANEWLEEVCEETRSLPDSFDDSERKFFLDYYAHLIDPARKEFFKHHLGQRIAAVIYHLQDLGPSCKILDLACGVGTQALLFARLGYSVTGFDLYAREITILKKRIEFYQPKWKIPLSVTLRTANAVRLDARELGQFDCVHVFEALSHIHPMEKFLETARLLVRPGGYLIISDTNGFNPIVRLKLWRYTGRWSYSVKTIQDSTSGKMVEYAFKRVMSAPAMRALLAHYGFEVQKTYGSGFIPAPVARSPRGYAMAKKLESIFVRLPGHYMFGVSYTVIAQKT